MQETTVTATFDPLTFLEHIWNESSTSILLGLTIVFGGLLIWVAFKKFR